MIRERHEAAREREFVRQDLIAQVAKDNLILSNASSDERVMTMRRNRIMAAENQERQIVESVHRETSRRRAVQQRASTEAAVAVELQKMRDLTLRDEKMRQQLCETEPEIRELRAKLDAGYVSREVRSQIGQNVQLREDTLRLKQETGRMLETQRQEWELDELKGAKDKFVKTKVYQSDLDAQLAEEEARKVEAYEQFIKDKQMIDEIVNRIHEEDSAYAREVQAKKIRNRAEMEEFEQQQEDYRRRNEEKVARENAILAEQAAELEARSAGEVMKKAASTAARDALQAEMGAKLAAQHAQMLEDEELRNMLMEEEENQRLEEQAKAEAEKKLRRRIEMLRDHDEAVYIKQMKAEQEVQEEQEFRAAMLEKFARDDRLEQLSAQKRRMKGLEHGRAVEDLIAERRQRIAIERERQEAALAQEGVMKEARRRLIEEERQKLLREHAVKLLGYLPKGVIRDHGDLETLGNDFQTAYRTAPDPYGF